MLPRALKRLLVKFRNRKKFVQIRGRKSLIETARDEQTITRKPNSIIIGKNGEERTVPGKRALGKVEHYPYANSPLSKVETRCAVTEKTMERILLGEKNPIVVDWGCGRGNAIIELAEKFESKKKKPRCFGYSKEFYEDWKSGKKVEFLYAPLGELKRHFKDNSIDVIYSYSGMIYLTPEKQSAELHALIPKLKIGGYILLDIGTPSIIQKLKKIEEIEVKVKTDDSIEIKRIK